MLESQLLGGQLFSPSPRNRNGGSLRRSDNSEVARSDFDLAGVHVRVSHLDRTRCDFTFEGYYRLETELAGTLDCVARRPLWIEGYLNESSAIAKVKEYDSAKISRPVYPAAKFDFGADV